MKDFFQFCGMILYMKTVLVTFVIIHTTWNMFNDMFESSKLNLYETYIDSGGIKHVTRNFIKK